MTETSGLHRYVLVFSIYLRLITNCFEIAKLRHLNCRKETSPITEQSSSYGFAEGFEKNTEAESSCNKGFWALRVRRPRSVIDSSNVFKTPTERDLLWAEECAKIADTKLGRVQLFVKYPIKAQTML
jgi:hypothetical protein